MQVGDLAGRRAARVDHDDLPVRMGLLGLLGLLDPLVHDRVTPGGVGAHQDDQLGGLQIGIVAGHGVGPECALVACDTGSHTEP